MSLTTGLFWFLNHLCNISFHLSSLGPSETVTYSTYTTSIYTCISPSSPVHGGEFHKRKQLNIYTKYISNDNISFACTSASFTYDYARPVTLVNVTSIYSCQLPPRRRRRKLKPLSALDPSLNRLVLILLIRSSWQYKSYSSHRLFLCLYLRIEVYKYACTSYYFF